MSTRADRGRRGHGLRGRAAAAARPAPADGAAAAASRRWTTRPARARPKQPLETLLGVQIDVLDRSRPLAWAGLIDCDRRASRRDRGRERRRPSRWSSTACSRGCPTTRRPSGELLTGLGSMARTTVTERGRQLRARPSWRQTCAASTIRRETLPVDLSCGPGSARVAVTDPRRPPRCRRRAVPRCPPRAGSGRARRASSCSGWGHARGCRERHGWPCRTPGSAWSTTGPRSSRSSTTHHRARLVGGRRLRPARRR